MKKKIVVRLMAAALVTGTFLPQVAGPAVIYAAETENAESLDPANLKNGTYQVKIEMDRAGKPGTVSMANQAVESQADLVVKDGQYYLHVEFKGMAVAGMTGYLRSLSYWNQTQYQEAQVLEHYEDVKDSYNDTDQDGTAEWRYPKKQQIPLLNKNTGDAEGCVKCMVNVPIMDQMGVGNQEVYLNIDWNTLTAVQVEEAQKPDQDQSAEKNGPKVTTLKDASYSTGVAFSELGRYESDESGTYVEKISNVTVNGREYTKDYDESNPTLVWDDGAFSLEVYNGAFQEGDNEILIKASGYRDKKIIFKQDGNTYTFVSQEDVAGSGQSEGEQEQEEQNGDATVLKDGVYTLSFQANQEGKQESSMLQGAFDPRVKLTVEDGNMKITMRNTALVWALMDFSIESDGEYPASQQQYIGQTDASGNYAAQEFTMPIKSLSGMHKGAVLVSAMGGQVSDKGNYEKYTKLDITFGDEIKEGWNGYLQDEEQSENQTGDERLVKALVEKGYDTDQDGSISEKELQAISGPLDLSHYNLTDISMLKGLSNKVTSIDLTGNKIEALPEGLLDQLTELTEFHAANNLIREIPEGFFKNNQKLTWVNLASNLISSLKKDQLYGLTAATEIDFGNNQIESVEADALKELKKLDAIALNGNKLTSIEKGTFASQSKVTLLNLEENALTVLPEEIQELSSLQTLNAGKNKITTIGSVDFSKLEKLKSVNLSMNQITGVKTGTFAGNKQLEDVNLYDNGLTTFSAEVFAENVTLRKLDLQMNYLDSLDENVRKLAANSKVYPQKNVVSLKLEKNGEQGLSWSQELSLLDLLYWYENTISQTKTEITTVEEYQNMLQEEGISGKDMTQILNDKSYDWSIYTELQKKNADGTYTTVKKSQNDDQADVTSGAENTLENGSYRIIKSMYSTTWGSKTYRYSVVSNEVELGDASGENQHNGSGSQNNQNSNGGAENQNNQINNSENTSQNSNTTTGKLAKVSSQSGKTSSVKTGDYTSVWGVVTGMILAVGAAGTVIFKRKRQTR